MTGRTHDLAGFTLLLTTAIFTETKSVSVATLIVALLSNQIGALFPDLDQATSNAWDRFPAGHYLARIFSPLAGGHRHITHSLLGLVLFGLLSLKVLEAVGSVLLVDTHVVWIAFMIGFVSHLLMDLLTDVGLPLLWPLKFKFGVPPTRKLRPATGGWVEMLIIFPGLVLINFYLIYTHYNKITAFFKEGLFR